MKKCRAKALLITGIVSRSRYVIFNNPVSLPTGNGPLYHFVDPSTFLNVVVERKIAVNICSGSFM
jgi:hypothetical protein